MTGEYQSISCDISPKEIQCWLTISVGRYMSMIIERYEEFTTAVANETIGHVYTEKITAVEIRGLGVAGGRHRLGITQ